MSKIHLFLIILILTSCNKNGTDRFWNDYTTIYAFESAISSQIKALEHLKNSSIDSILSSESEKSFQLIDSIENLLIATSGGFIEEDYAIPGELRFLKNPGFEGSFITIQSKIEND